MKIETDYKGLTLAETIERLKEMISTQQPYRYNDETIYSAINYLNTMKTNAESEVTDADSN